ncbi:MAG: hypothetical protein C0410_15470 [Anaerolinea sp.]|nr:hypothetical protein [Anaerolinea sp.]
MADIMVYISSSSEMVDEIVTSQKDNIKVLSRNKQVPETQTRFGLAEGIVIVTAIKGLAELLKVCMEIYRMLREKNKKGQTVTLDFPNGHSVSINDDTHFDDIETKIKLALTE